MKFTLSWLKDHLDTQASLAEIVDTLTRVGLEVEGVEDAGAKYKGFVVARVIEAKQHPERRPPAGVCMVDAGGAPVQVVCGAPNARTGMKSVFSPVGTYIPGKKMTLAKGVIRGVESNGMLCSAAELELVDDHDGIIELPDDAPVGVAYATLRRPRRSRHRRRADAEPARRDRRRRHRARSRRGRARQAEDATRRRPVAGAFDCPIDVTSRISRPKTRVSALPSRCGWCAASRTARRRNGCRSDCAQSASGRSTRWSTSPTTSPSTAAGHCTCSTSRKSRAISTSAVRAPARACSRSTARPMRSTRRWWPSPTPTASSRSLASWAASIPAATTTPTTC